MNTEALAKWDRVLTRLWHVSRFSSYFYQAVRLVPDSNLPTLALIVSAHRFSLIFNPPFVLKTRRDDLLGLLIHEMLHVILNHDHRARPGQDPFLQNLAQDMVINSYLEKHKTTFFTPKTGQRPVSLVLPPGLPHLPAELIHQTEAGKPSRGRLGDYTWEEVYAWLLKTQQETGIFSLNGPGSAHGLPEYAPVSWRKSDTGSALQGLTFINDNGQPLPTGMHLFDRLTVNNDKDAGKKRLMRFIQSQNDCRQDRIFQEVTGLIETPRPVNTARWKTRIKHLVRRAAPSSRWEYSSARFNRRFFAQGIYAPGRRYLEKTLITVAVDVSGSMAAHPRELESAFGAVEDLLPDFYVSLICVDQEVFVPRRQKNTSARQKTNCPFFYKKGDWQFIRTGSRGTTFFAPLFNEYLAGHREMVIVITDGYIYDLQRIIPYFPTLWVLAANGNPDFAPPFGTAVTIGEQP